MGSFLSFLNPSGTAENTTQDENNNSNIQTKSFRSKTNISKDKTERIRKNTTELKIVTVEDTLDIIKIDTLIERLERQKNMTGEEIQKEEEEYKILTKESVVSLVVLEKCSFCKDRIGDVEINSCNHPLCQECFGISQLEGNHCMVEGCEKTYTQVKNLKTGQILNLE